MIPRIGKSMFIKAFHLSAQGASHIRKNKECQDASYSYFDENCAVAIVCDGHGGDDYVRSAVGAEYACQSAAESIQVFLRDIDREAFLKSSKIREEKLDWLEASIINAWNKKIDDHYHEHPFQEAELAVLSDRARDKYLQKGKIASAYGTTLIAAVMTPDYWFGIQIGDGRCVVVDRNSCFSQPIPWNEKCFLNATTSICDSNAMENFRHYYAETLPAAIFIGSDGIDDCFCDEQQLNHLYQTVLYSFATSDFEQAVADLADYLPRLSSKGSGDDVSISAIFDLNEVQHLMTVQESYQELKQARSVENKPEASDLLPSDEKESVQVNPEGV